MTTPSGRPRLRPLILVERVLGMRRLEDAPTADEPTPRDGRASAAPLVEPVAVAPRSTRPSGPAMPAAGIPSAAGTDPERPRTKA